MGVGAKSSIFAAVKSERQKNQRMSQTGKKKVLVTGASGFIGSFMVSDGLDRGYEMWAGMRRSSSKQYLTDGRIKFAELDLGNPNRLR